MSIVERELLRLLAEMPFLDRLEAVAVSGWSRGAVYQAVDALTRSGQVVAVSHATQLIHPTRRYCLTTPGLYRLAREEEMQMEELLHVLPVSEQWRRLLLERLDAVASIYRLVSAVSGIAYPVKLQWYRAKPFDAAVRLPDDRVIYILRQGPTTERAAFSKRLWRLRKTRHPSAVLLMAADEARLRQIAGRLSGLPFPAYLALEKDAVSAGDRAFIWRTPSRSAPLDLRTALNHATPGDGLPPVESQVRASLPIDLFAKNELDCLLPVLLKPVEKRALDLLYDWPWLKPPHLAALLGLKMPRLSEVVARIVELGLASNCPVMGRRRLALSDRGVGMLARRDRASVGAAKRRWSASRNDSDSPIQWRDVYGRRSRQLLRNLEHTESVHWFLAVLARQVRCRSTEIVQLDSPRQASRYFRYEDRMCSVQPDAFGVLRRGNEVWSFFLEWERRAVRPVTMAARLAPYLRYYSTHKPTDQHGSPPAVLIVFEDDLAKAHFLKTAGVEMKKAGVRVPLLVSHKGLLERVGPFGLAWTNSEGSGLSYAFSRSQDKCKKCR